MTMGVGLRIGDVVSTAVVASNDPGSPDPVVIVRDTVLHMLPGGTAVFGGGTPSDPGVHSISGFLSRVGHTEGVEVGGGMLYRAEDLVAGAIRCLLRDCEPLPRHGGRHGGAPDIMASYPTRWDASAVAALNDALQFAGLSHISLVSDAEATSAWFESEIAEQPGQLVGIYHVDDTGTTVALIRSGVAAGKAFRYARGGSPASQLATALGAFGWLPENLDAVVVTGDGLIARDAPAIRAVAESVSAKLAVHCVIGPGPEQTAALGAAIRATGFNPTTHRVSPIGLPPSYDITEVIDAIATEEPERLVPSARPSVQYAAESAPVDAPVHETRAPATTAVATRARREEPEASSSGSAAFRFVPAMIGAIVLVGLVIAAFVLLWG
ncbi:hypothetical protein G4H71_21930 [Rhodococcus triatomae]|uniref:Uncharacterized protein n=1 Tax=Rhodococcus triatomae TaxID=300028 RepID=A0A1G8P6X7_9NOCA|nr:hypothetical protein [Rhodococcus triatomae]QNG18737.1 hypothetical protein G4H72_08450 [Rhodococcus triatomae]QNG25353.1 hypothetical protein G4H71_21930 [Rhodococcus triatomae]SDI88095.1 hypothetical protein SAMN05444695_11279 [Rhodococcus triatomae]